MNSNVFIILKVLLFYIKAFYAKQPDVYIDNSCHGWKDASLGINVECNVNPLCSGLDCALKQNLTIQDKIYEVNFDFGVEYNACFGIHTLKFYFDNLNGSFAMTENKITYQYSKLGLMQNSSLFANINFIISKNNAADQYIGKINANFSLENLKEKKKFDTVLISNVYFYKPICHDQSVSIVSELPKFTTNNTSIIPETLSNFTGIECVINNLRQCENNQVCHKNISSKLGGFCFCMFGYRIQKDKSCIKISKKDSLPQPANKLNLIISVIVILALVLTGIIAISVIHIKKWRNRYNGYRSDLLIMNATSDSEDPDPPMIEA